MSSAIVVKADDWEGLFVNRKCVFQNHSLNQGQERLEYFLEVSLKYNFMLEDVKFKRCTDEYYESYLSDYGSFPDNLSEIELED